MHEIERYRHSLHAKTSGYKRKVERATAIIEEAFDCIRRPYVAFSGGVDSTVLLDMVYRVNACPVLWGDDGYDYPESLDFLRDAEARYGFHLRRIRCWEPWNEWCYEMGRPDLYIPPLTKASEEAWGNPLFHDRMWPRLSKEACYEYDGVFLGLLASESRGRNYQLQDGFRPLYQVKAEQGMWHCSPLASWTKRDVWAYVVSRELPYNAAYSRLAEMDVPLERRRVAPLTCFRVTQYGSHVTLKRGWPELWNKLAATFPRVREYS